MIDVLASDRESAAIAESAVGCASASTASIFELRLLPQPLLEPNAARCCRSCRAQGATEDLCAPQRRVEMSAICGAF